MTSDSGSTRNPAGTPASAVTRSERTLGVTLAILAGAAIAVQFRINGELGTRLGDGVLAALISFGTGLTLLVLATPLTSRGRAGLARLRAALRARSLRVWECLGGVGGAALVATQGLTVGELGVAVFVVAVVAGQTGSSLLVDKVGLGPGGGRPVTWPRVIAATLALLAVFGTMSGRMDGDLALWLLAAPLIAGCGTAAQQAVNGQVRDAAQSAWTATLLNFSIGTVTLTLAWLTVRAMSDSVPEAPFRLPTDVWLYLGGPLGAVFIGVAAAVVRWTGVLLFGLAAIAGQLTGAVVLDFTIPTQGAHLNAVTLLGVGATLLAVGIAASSRSGQPS